VYSVVTVVYMVYSVVLGEYLLLVSIFVGIGFRYPNCKIMYGLEMKIENKIKRTYCY